MNQNTYLWPRLGEISFVGFEIWCSQGFGTHILTHSLTDGEARIQYAFGAVFQRWKGA